MELRKSLRRKASANIRSPAVRRNSAAEVILKGWLYKLEGSTIKQWKKRWFVLSDYCLFFYKGPDEEKYLGSVLLPSYKIRPCTSEDKVSHKNAFMAEHKNMKTHYFAAENSTGMCQWMNAMCLASLMQREPQRGVEQCPQHNLPPSYDATGIDIFRPQLTSRHPPPAHHFPHDEVPFEGEDYGENGFLLSGQQYPCSYTQSPIYDTRPSRGVVYANAPPKPRRLSPPPNDSCGFESPVFGEESRGSDPPTGAEVKMRPVYSTSCGNRFGKTVPLRPRSADFLDRGDEERRPQLYRSARGRPKSSMAHYDWEDDEEHEVWREYGEGAAGPQYVAGGWHSVAERLMSTPGNVQEKKVTHKEESMKRLLEWKQRMLQSPLRKKQGGMQGISSPDIHSAVEKRTVSSWGLELIHPPERPPLPKEYQAKLAEVAQGQETHIQLLQHGSKASFVLPYAQDRLSVGDASNVQAVPGPDLIQHTKISPTPTKPSAADSPDYVNLRNLRFSGPGLRTSQELPRAVPNGMRVHTSERPSSVNLPGTAWQRSSTPQQEQGTTPHPSTGYVMCIQRRQPMLQKPTYQNVIGSRSTPNNYETVSSTQSFTMAGNPPQRGKHTGEWSDDCCVSVKKQSAIVQGCEEWHQDADVMHDKPGGVEPKSCAPSALPLQQKQPVQVDARQLPCIVDCTQEIQSKAKAAVQEWHPDATSTCGLSTDALLPHVKLTPQSPGKSPGENAHSNSHSVDTREDNNKSDSNLMSLQTEVESPSEADSDVFAIHREDYYRASQLFYSKQPLSKGLLGSVLDNSGSSLEVETFDSRYRKNCNTPKGPEWELDKDVGLPLPDNLDLSFHSTSSNSVFEAPYESPGDQSPELFQGTLRPSRTYVRARQSSSNDTSTLAPRNEASSGLSLLKVPSLDRCQKEMSCALLKKKEAPSVSIVQDRIKRFETKDDLKAPENLRGSPEGTTKGSASDSDEPDRKKSHESDSSADIATTKSVHTVQSPSSSVLKETDMKKESAEQCSSTTADDYEIISMGGEVVAHDTVNNCSAKSLETHYVPMGGWLAKEGDYVMMSMDSTVESKREKPSCSKPMPPIPNFVQEPFGKTGSLVREKPENNSSGSSSDCSTENIYEHVRRGLSTDPASETASSKGRDESEKTGSAPIYEEPYGIGAPLKRTGDTLEQTRLNMFTLKQLHSSKSLTKKPFPDLLHHEEVKDSGASDADDEASRADFDSAASSLPSYQKEVLNEPHLGAADSTSHIIGSQVRQAYSPVYATRFVKYSPQKDCAPKQDSTKIEGGTKEQNSTEGAVALPMNASLSRSGLNPICQKAPSMGDRSASIGLLKNVYLHKGSHEENFSAGPLGAAVPNSRVEDVPSDTNGSGPSSPVPSPLLSSAPDILPSEARTVVSETSCKKSPTMAPYYYSDIFGERPRGQARSHRLSQHTRVASNVLNNIREVGLGTSVTKGNVGRRVNDISTSTPTVVNVNHARTRSEPGPTTEEFEITIRGLLDITNGRKFSDAEKNKYVAGHTLEKTPHTASLVLSGTWKQRHGVDSERPEEREARCSSVLPRRLSRSLEDVIDVQESVSRSKTPVSGASDPFDEPYYENVGFSSTNRPQKTRSSAGPQVSPAKHSVYDGENLCGELEVESIVQNLFGNVAGFLGVPTTSPAIFCNGMAHLPRSNTSCNAANVGSEVVPANVRTYEDESSKYQASGKRSGSSDFTETKELDYNLRRHCSDSLYTYRPGCYTDTPTVDANVQLSPTGTGLSHSISAGDLLGKSHEELVLLLIHLRRSRDTITASKLCCEAELQELKENVVHRHSRHTAADVQRLVSLQRNLNELNRSLGLTQPLISLVENMVKLGSLYNVTGSVKPAGAGTEEEHTSSSDPMDADTPLAQQEAVEKKIAAIKNLLADSSTLVGPSREDLEVELQRLQKLVEDLLQKKLLSSTLPTEDVEKPTKTTEINLFSTSVTSRRKHERTYYETDLDSCITSDVATDGQTSHTSPMENVLAETAADGQCYQSQDINEADDRTKKFYGILPRDRAQEIKTVRIVKRESERRQRGRDHRRKGPSEEGLWDARLEGSLYGDRCEQEPSSDDGTNQLLTFGDEDHAGGCPAELSFQQSSQSSKPEVTTPSSGDNPTSSGRKNGIRRSKRRHYTISGSHPFLDQHCPPKLPASLRSRDDMDMERCLRTVNTPDIVRSTIKKSDVYDEQIIDRQIGLPQKILIPERYIEVESENVSAVERLRRSLKAANIRKMLTDSVAYDDLGARNSVEEVRSKLGEEKRRRAHLLALNHSIAKEVMERSKMVAAHITSLENPQ